MQSKQDAGKLLRNLVDYAGSFEVTTCLFAVTFCAATKLTKVR